MYLIIIALACLFASSNATAEPRQWDRNGLPVRAVRVIDDFASASRTDGTTLVVWSQSDGDLPVVKGQLISSAGAPLWADDGITLAQGEERSCFPDVAAVDGGWIIIWLHGDIIYTGRGERSDFYSNAELRAQKFDNNGAPLWTGGRQGVAVTSRLEWGYLRSYTVNPSGGGAIISWSDWYDHSAQRINADGTFAWNEPVILPDLDYLRRNVASDGAGGLLIVNEIYNGGVNRLVANKLLPDGTFAWNNEDGIDIIQDNNLSSSSICTDGAGGAFVCWSHNQTPYAALAQRISSTGSLLWATQGSPVISLSGSAYGLRIATSYTAGLVDGFVAAEIESDGNDIRLVGQKVSLEGQPVWDDNGHTICETNQQFAQFFTESIASDRSGGLICAANRYEYSDHETDNLLVTRVAADASAPWQNECGVVVSSLEYGRLPFGDPVVVNNKVRALWLSRYQHETNAIGMQELDLATGALETPEPLLVAPGDGQEVRKLNAVKLVNGATATVWDVRYGVEYTLYFQIVDVFGNKLLPEPGRLLCHDDSGAPVYGSDAALCPDGSGGFFAAFRSYDPAEGYYQLRAVHIDANGNHLSPTEGVNYIDDRYLEYNSQYFKCHPDGTGGCYIAVSAFSHDFILHVTLWRVDANCAPVWDQPLDFGDNLFDYGAFLLAPTTNNSILLGYTRIEFGNSEQRAARISPNGEVEWNISVVNGISEFYYDIGACTDHNGGMYLTWRMLDNTEDVYRGFIQRVSPAGDLLFGTGVVLYESESGVRNLKCSADVLGNVNVVWELYNQTDMDIYAQRIRANGTIAWQENGLPIASAPHDQYSPNVITISDNEVYFIWQDDRNVNGNYFWQSDIYGSHLNARGQLGDDSYWQENGSPICIYSYYQYTPVAVNDGAGGVTLAWLDSRVGFGWNFSVFAQRLYDPIFTDAEETPVLPTEFSLAQNYPNPFNPTTVIEFALPTASHTSLKIFDITGRLVATLVDGPQTTGTHHVSFDGSKLASGLYFYKLEAADKSFTRKMALIK
jgi:hypothetical protein